jgi:hypothetical protein
MRGRKRREHRLRISTGLKPLKRPTTPKKIAARAFAPLTHPLQDYLHLRSLEYSGKKSISTAPPRDAFGATWKDMKQTPPNPW